jgi:hypothetical protein
MEEPKIDLDPRPKKRWKVGVIMMKMDAFTVQARTPEEAVDAVKQGQGRPAGSTQPVVQEFQVIEMGAKGEIAGSESIIKRPTILGPGGAPV